MVGAKPEGGDGVRGARAGKTDMQQQQQRPQPPPVHPNAVLRVAERARRYLKPLLGTDVALASVERATGFAWCPAHGEHGETRDPFLSMRLQAMSDSAFEHFLRALESVVVSMPDACVSVQSTSDSTAVCGDLWNELRAPLATWVDAGDFAAHVHAVCDRIASHYATIARAQLVEQLAGMRTLGRVCCAGGMSDESGRGLLQQAVQDEAFMRTMANPCAILKEEMRQARVPLRELSTCLEYESLVAARGPASLAPCLAARQVGLMRWVEEHASGASVALTSAINRVRRLTDPTLGASAWSDVTVCHVSAAPLGRCITMRLPSHAHLCTFEKLAIVASAADAACSAPLHAVRITSVVRQLVEGCALLPRTFAAGTLLALLARVSAEAEAQGGTCEGAELPVPPVAALGYVQRAEADEEEEGEAEGDEHGDLLAYAEDDEEEDDAGGDDGEEGGADAAGPGSVSASPLLHIKTVSNAGPGSVLVRMPPHSGAAGVPASLMRESAVFTALEALLHDATARGKDAARTCAHEVASRAAVRAAALGQTSRAVAQNTSIVLRKFVPHVHKYAEAMAGGPALKAEDLCYVSDAAWRGPGRCVVSTAHGREWALLCLAALRTRIETDPNFAREWHGSRRNKSKARRRTLKATHAVAASTAAAALAD